MNQWESHCIVCGEYTTFYFGGTPIHPECFEKMESESKQ